MCVAFEHSRNVYICLLFAVLDASLFQGVPRERDIFRENEKHRVSLLSLIAHENSFVFASAALSHLTSRQPFLFSFFQHIERLYAKTTLDRC